MILGSPVQSSPVQSRCIGPLIFFFFWGGGGVLIFLASEELDSDVCIWDIGLQLRTLIKFPKCQSAPSLISISPNPPSCPIRPTLPPCVRAQIGLCSTPVSWLGSGIWGFLVPFEALLVPYLRSCNLCKIVWRVLKGNAS